MSWYTENIKSETAFGSDFLGSFSADDADQSQADQGQADQGQADQGQADQGDADQGGGGGGGGSPAEPAKQTEPAKRKRTPEEERQYSELLRQRGLAAQRAYTARAIAERQRAENVRQRGLAAQRAYRASGGTLTLRERAIARSRAGFDFAGSDFGLGTVIPESTVKSVPIKAAPTTALLVLGGALALGMGAIGYKFLSEMGKEHQRLTPRRRF